MSSRNISRSKIVLNPLHPDRAFIPTLRVAEYGDFPHGGVKASVAQHPFEDVSVGVRVGNHSCLNLAIASSLSLASTSIQGALR